MCIQLTHKCFTFPERIIVLRSISSSIAVARRRAEDSGGVPSSSSSIHQRVLQFKERKSSGGSSGSSSLNKIKIKDRISFTTAATTAAAAIVVVVKYYPQQPAVGQLPCMEGTDPQFSTAKHTWILLLQLALLHMVCNSRALALS